MLFQGKHAGIFTLVEPSLRILGDIVQQKNPPFPNWDIPREM